MNRRTTPLDHAGTAFLSVKPASRCLRLPPVTPGACTPGVHQPMCSCAKSKARVPTIDDASVERTLGGRPGDQDEGYVETGDDENGRRLGASRAPPTGPTGTRPDRSLRPDARRQRLVLSPRSLLESQRSQLNGKVIVDCVNPARVRQAAAGTPYRSRRGRCRSTRKQFLTGFTVVGAFHNVSAVMLGEPPARQSTSTCSSSATCARRPTSCGSSATLSPGGREICGRRLRNTRMVEASPPTSSRSTAAVGPPPGVRITDV